MRTLIVLLFAITSALYTHPAIAQIGPEWGDKVNIEFDKTNLPSDSYQFIENDNRYPAISPDGQWIAFNTGIYTNSIGTESGIWLAPSEGGKAELLCISGLTTLYCKCFTPDSKELLLQENIQSIIPIQGSQEPVYWTYNLKAINIETKEMRIVVENAAFARISGDGRYISYINKDPRANINPSMAEHNGAMTILDTQTGEKRYLTDENLSGDPLKYLYPTISPDMKWVYFNVMEFVDSNVQSQLYRMPFEGGQMEQLTFFKNVRFGYCENLNFSPNGKWLLFDYCWDILAYNTLTKEIFGVFPGTNTETPYDPAAGLVADAQGRIETHYGWETDPTWMPDGKSFIYNLWSGGRASYDYSGCDIYICQLDESIDGSPRELAVESENPESFALLKNYPNPFNPTTTIEFTVTKPGPINLSVYNITGQKVSELVSGSVTAGKHSVVWNGHVSKGTSLSTGIYISRLETKDKVISQRMLLVK